MFVDGSLDVIQNIESARQYGFVHDAVVNQITIKAVLKIFNAGDNSVRIYDADAGRYLSILAVSFATGMSNIDIPLKSDWGKSLRVDLFKGDMLVHYTDFENK